MGKSGKRRFSSLFQKITPCTCRTGHEVEKDYYYGKQETEPKLLYEEGIPLNSPESQKVNPEKSAMDQESEKHENDHVKVEIHVQPQSTESKQRKRPNSIVCNINPMQHIQNEDTWKILLNLSEHSKKLDNISSTLVKSKTDLSTFTSMVKQFHQSVENSLYKINQGIRKRRSTNHCEGMDSIFNGDCEKRNSRIATEHDELTSLIYQQEAAQAQPLNGRNTHSFFQDGVEVNLRPHSNAHLQVITDQFQELKKYAGNHTDEYESMYGELGDCISQIEQDVSYLSRRQNRQRRVKSEILCSRNFLLSSYPSPWDQECIEMEELSPR